MSEKNKQAPHIIASVKARKARAKDWSVIRARFESFVDRVSGPEFGDLGRCWVWTGSRNWSQHGKFRVMGKSLYAHRVSWFLKHGTWSSDKSCHKCDNPPCVNPDHLFDGTQADNIADMVSKSRQGKHEKALTPEQAAEILSFRDHMMSIGEARKLGLTHKKLAERYGVSTTTIFRCLHRVLGYKNAGSSTDVVLQGKVIDSGAGN